MQAPEHHVSASRSVPHAILGWLCIVVLAVVSVCACLRVPKPVNDSRPDQFASGRAMQLLHAIAQRPHPVGSADHERVLALLVQTMRELHLNPSLESHTSYVTTGRFTRVARITNLVGRLPGKASTKPVVLVAHYDSVDRAPGAADDGAAVAAILEALRAIAAGPALENDVIVLLTDGEELGLLGARAAISADPWIHDAGFILNMDARGDRGPVLLFETSDGNQELIRSFARVAPYPSGSSLFYSLYKLLPSDTDFSVFRGLRVPGLNIASVANYQSYHSRLDTVDNLEEGTLQQDGTYVLSLARFFGNADLSQAHLSGRGDAVFFNWFGFFMGNYPLQWVVPLFVAESMLLAGLMWRGLRRGQLSGRGLAGVTIGGLAVITCFVFVSAGSFFLLDSLAGDRLPIGDATPDLLLLIALLLISGAVILRLMAWLVRLYGLENDAFGGLLVVWILTLVLTVSLPAGSYLLFWPLLACTIASGWGGAPGRWLGLSLCILMFTPTVYLLFVGLQLSVPLLAVCGLLLGAGLLLNIAQVPVLVPRLRFRGGLGVIAMAGGLLLVSGVVLSRPSGAHPRPDTLEYVEHVDQGRAEWITFDANLDEWTRRQMGTSKQRGTIEAPWSYPVAVLRSDAPVFQTAKMAELVTDSSMDDAKRRTVHLHLAPLPKTGWQRITFPHDAGIEAVSVNGEQLGFDQHDEPRRADPAAPWIFDLYGADSAGFDLSIRMKASVCEAAFSNYLDGLPALVPPRGTEYMAWYGSDYTVLMRSVRYC